MSVLVRHGLLVKILRSVINILYSEINAYTTYTKENSSLPFKGTFNLILSFHAFPGWYTLQIQMTEIFLSAALNKRG